MPGSRRTIDATRSTLPQATTSLLSQSLASASSSPVPLAAPTNTSANNPPLQITLTQPNTTITSQTTTQQTTPAANPPPTIHAPHQRHLPTKWEPLPSRVHHRNDDVHNYCAPGSNGWVSWQEQRVADSQKEIGRIEHSWNGGVIIDYAERRKMRLWRTAEWIDRQGEVGDEGEEDGEKEGEEENKVDEEMERKPDTDGMEKRSHILEMKKVDKGKGRALEKQPDMIERKKVDKGKGRAMEDSTEDVFHDCLETLDCTEDQEEGSPFANKRGEEEEGWQTCTERYPETMRRWERVVRASRSQAGSSTHMAAELMGRENRDLVDSLRGDEEFRVQNRSSWQAGYYSITMNGS